MAHATIATLAREALNHMQEKARDNGESFYCFDANGPGWLTDLSRAAHGDLMPDDWRYRFIRDALYIVAGLDSDASEDDARDAIGDQTEADVYNADLLRWLASNLTRVGYVDEYREECSNYNTNTMRDIMGGQYREMVETGDAVVTFLLARLDELDGESAS